MVVDKALASVVEVGGVRAVVLLLHDPEHWHNRALLALQRVGVLGERERNLLLRLSIKLEWCVRHVVCGIVVLEHRTLATHGGRVERSGTRRQPPNNTQLYE